MVGHTKTGLKRLTVELLTTGLIGVGLLGPAVAQVAPAGGGPRSGNDASQTSTEDLRTILPLLLTSPDRKRLAVDLEAAIRTGDMRKAESSLNAAIEVGTLAIVLVDRLNDPNLAPALQGLGIRGDDGLTPEPPAADKAAAVEACAASPSPDASGVAAMQQALEEERANSGKVSQALAGLTQERDSLAERLDKETKAQALASSELRQALQREQDQSRAAIGELEKLKAEYRALQAATEQEKATEATSASERDAVLRRERERGDEAERRLAGAETELRNLRAFKEEKMASDTARVAELKKALAVAEWRGDMLTRELVDTDDELRALQEPKRPSATPVVFRLAAAGTELPLATAQEEAPPAVPEVKTPAVASDKALPDVTSALRQELAPVVVASLPEAIQPLPLGTATAAPTKTEAPSGPEPKAGASAEAPRVDDRLMKRAEELFRKGDVSAARLLFERAMDGGNARAAFLLAETFDPNVLSRLGVLGIRGDAGKAREYYARARALGIAQAGERMEALK
ncbi:hypothetical protein [Microvirga calopogonii]|uniref:hypothetical protein n=1 Tax=Microvirga calopogonii TaxID=2078013 RepID=UPI000E0D441D|nr:hypothetical protein [Microvirga calopogonii]